MNYIITEQFTRNRIFLKGFFLRGKTLLKTKQKISITLIKEIIKGICIFYTYTVSTVMTPGMEYAYQDIL